MASTRLNIALIILEQYAYMCDLKRTLDATVLVYYIYHSKPNADYATGPLRLRNAVWNREDGVFVVSHCLLPAGAHSVLP